MSDTAAADPPPPSSKGSSFAATHPVKKLLETYRNTAGRTLTGPANSALETGPYARGGGNGPSRGPTPSYKLPPDVELSKTVDDDDHPAPGHAHDRTIPPQSPKEYYLQQQQQGYGGHHHHGHHGDNVKAEKMAANGITLSRIDDHGPDHEKSYNNRQRTTSGESAHSTHSSHHGSAQPPHPHPPQQSPGQPQGEIPYHMMARHQEELRRRQQQQQQMSPRQQLPSPGGQQGHAASKGPISVINFDRLTEAQEKALRAKGYPPQSSPGNGRSAHHDRRPPPPGAVPAPHQFKRPSTGGQQQPPAPAPLQQHQPQAEPAPVLSPRDLGQAELRETFLNGEAIACFSVGGEYRLCLPQILNTVLDSLSLQSIYAACDDLQIYCSTCSQLQLKVLKQHKILPVTASQCGLITKSDAERLIATLLERNPPRASLAGFDAKKSPFSFKVEHHCFGKCVGILLPEACIHPNSRCIECLECEGLFTPVKFVTHAHKNAENRTCHWGFDSANWRSYLRLWEGYDSDEKEKERMEKRFAEFKARFAVLAQQQTPAAVPVAGGEGTPPVRATAHTPGSGIMAAIANIHGKRKQSDDSPLSRTSSSASAGSGSHQQTSPGLPIPPVKKSRLSTESGDGYQSGSPQQTNPAAYNNMYMYQTWMAAMAKSNGSNGGMHPAAAQWMANMTQAMKEGKIPPGMFPPNAQHGGSYTPPNGRNGGSGSERNTPARSPTPTKFNSGHAPRAPPQHHAHSDQQRRRSSSSPNIGREIAPGVSKATSLYARSPTPSGGNGTSIRDRSPAPAPTVAPPRGSPSSSSTAAPTVPAGGATGSSLLGGRGSLAEDIHFIKEAIAGASSSAREQTLKILERLTARIALAESERDSANSNFTILQKRFHNIEEELAKKRAELRELLRQETAAAAADGQPCDSPPPPTVSSEPPPSTLHLRGAHAHAHSHHRQALTPLELLADSRAHAPRRSSNFAAGLPKVDLKSPARLISEEQQQRSASGCRSSGSTPRSSSGSRDRGTPVLEDGVPAVAAAVAAAAAASSSASHPLHSRVAQRHRSGTPSSTKSKESNQEELQNRMEFLESEVQFLRDALVRKKELESKQQKEKEAKEAVSEETPTSEEPSKPDDNNGHDKNGSSNGNGKRPESSQSKEDEDAPPSKAPKVDKDSETEDKKGEPPNSET